MTNNDTQEMITRLKRLDSDKINPRSGNKSTLFGVILLAAATALPASFLAGRWSSSPTSISISSEGYDWLIAQVGEKYDLLPRAAKALVDEKTGAH